MSEEEVSSTQQEETDPPPAEDSSTKPEPPPTEVASTEPPPTEVASTEPPTEDSSTEPPLTEDSPTEPAASTEPPPTEESSTLPAETPSTEPPAEPPSAGTQEEAAATPERPLLKMVAVIIGGTGATGRCLVSHLLKSSKEEWSKVISFSRRPLANIRNVNLEEEKSQGRLVEHIGDMFDISDDDIKSKCEGADVFFCCLGTTRSAAGSAEMFVRIDRDIVVKFARQAKAAAIPHFSVLTSIGANSNSFFLYTKTKGEVEDAVRGLGFSYTTILRAGLLGRGDEARFVEKLSRIIFRAIPVETVAAGMAIDAYQYKSASSTATAANNSVIMSNADIYRIVQDSTTRQ